MRHNNRDDENSGILRDPIPHRASATGSIEKPPVVGWVNYASWFSDDLMLIVGSFSVAEENSLTMSLQYGTRSIPLETRCMSFHRPDLPGAEPWLGKVVTAKLLHGEYAFDPIGTVMVHAGTTRRALGPMDVAQAVTDLHTLLRGSLAWWDRDVRTKVMEFLSSALTQHRTANELRLSKSLFVAREVLRARLPSATIDKGKAQGLHVETILAIDDKSFYVKGWMRDEEAEITQLRAVSPEGTETEILKGAFRYPRPDVEQFYDTHSSLQLVEEAGFIAYFETEAPSRLRAGWVFQMRNATGSAVEVNAPNVIRDDLTVREMVLKDLIYERPPEEGLTAEHAFPAISRIQERLKTKVEVKNVAHYGTPNQTPEVSIIVPLYQRVDLLEQQLAQFAHDPEVRRADLIYVLDSPELYGSLAATASQLFQLYRIPFRIVTLNRNAGFSAVNNIGASLARGRLLLLLNSDVLPDKPGWLGKMRTFYDSTPGIGGLAPKLLYEDDSLQHAGIYFAPLTGTSVWENRHYFKGLHRHLPAANLTCRVPAVTGACMMIDAALYEQFHGLRGAYVQGDYEDSDLCLRLAQQGFENWYLPDVELYHLEGQSYATATRQLNGRYNAWLHTRLWKERTESMTNRYTSVGPDRETIVGPGGRRESARSAAAGSSTGEQEGSVTGPSTGLEKRNKRRSRKKGQEKT